jgi:hypothetical protein
MSSVVALSVNDWNPSEMKYMIPKINDKGGKSINIISKQTNKTLSISTPLMMTWGVSDYVDEKGESDGKFNIKLNFPIENYATPATNAFYDKIQKFEKNFLDDAVKNSESWFGEEKSLDICKHMFFPILKYSKNKDTKKIDTNKPPSISAKVQKFDDKWNVEIYDVKNNLIFPNDDKTMTPMDFIPKLSTVACILSISQVWIGGKGMGFQIRLNQCMVKPPTVSTGNLSGCQIKLSEEDMAIMEGSKEEEVIKEDESNVILKKKIMIVKKKIV